MRRARAWVGIMVVLVMVVSLLSGCIGTNMDEVVFVLDEPLNENQTLFVRYNDGSVSSVGSQPGVTRLVMDTDPNKFVVGGYIQQTDGINHDAINWVPEHDYNFEDAGGGSVRDIVNLFVKDKIPPQNSAQYAVVQDRQITNVYEDETHASVTFAVYAAGGEEVEDRISVFALSEGSTKFVDNEQDESNRNVVSMGYASYTTGGMGKVTFEMVLPGEWSEADLGAVPLKLYYGPELIYGSEAVPGLTELKVSSGSLEPSFDPDVEEYTVHVPYSAEDVTVTGSVYDMALSTLTIHGADVPSGVASGSIPLDVGDNPIPVTVAHKWSGSTTYMVNVIRALNEDTRLTSLTLSDGTLLPAFISDTSSYSASVANSVSSLTVTPTAAVGASVTVNGDLVNSGHESGEINLDVGDNEITLLVTAQNGVATETYTVIVNRAGAPVTGGGNEDDDADEVPASPSQAPPSTPLKSTDGKLKLPQGRAGEVSMGETFKLLIPAGAASRPLNLTVEEVEDTVSLLTNDEVLASPVYELLKDFSEDFSEPVTLTFAIDPGSVSDGQRAAVFYYDEADKVWVEVPGSRVEGSEVSVDVDHFTKFAVLAVEDVEVALPVDEVELSDIAGHWAEANIREAVGLGIVKGYTDGTFQPDAHVSRAEFTVMLMQAIGAEEAGAQLDFTDGASIEPWAQQAVAQAVAAGILRGYEDGSFRPNAKLQRAEMAAMIAKAAGITLDPTAVTQFADDALIPVWAKGAIAALQAQGLVQGDASNAYHPGGQTTRAEAVAVLLRLASQ